MWHWSDILEEYVDVDWHSFSFLKSSHETLDLKLNIKWNLSNIHIAHAPSPYEENNMGQGLRINMLWRPKS